MFSTHQSRRGTSTLNDAKTSIQLCYEEAAKTGGACRDICLINSRDELQALIRWGEEAVRYRNCGHPVLDVLLTDVRGFGPTRPERDSQAVRRTLHPPLLLGVYLRLTR